MTAVVQKFMDTGTRPKKARMAFRVRKHAVKKQDDTDIKRVLRKAAIGDDGAVEVSSEDEFMEMFYGK